MKDNNIVPVILLTPIELVSQCIYPGETSDWLNVVGMKTGKRAIKGPDGSLTGWASTGNSVDTSTIESPTSFSLRFNLNLDAGQQRASMVGLGQNETSNSYQDIEFAFYFSQVPEDFARIYIYELGSYKALAIDTTPGDLDRKEFEIKVTNGLVEYLYEGNVIYTSDTTASGDYYFDTSSYYAGEWIGGITLENIEICS